MKKTYILQLIFISGVLFSCQPPKLQNTIELVSPNNKIKFKLISDHVNPALHYTIRWNDTLIIDQSKIALDLEGSEFDQLTIKEIHRIKRDSLFSPVIAAKRAIFRDRYNAILIDFKEPIGLEIRMYDEGLSYRWIGKSTRKLKVYEEEFEVNPIDNVQIYYAPYLQYKEPLTFIDFIKKQIKFFKNLFRIENKYESFFETQYQSHKISESPTNTSYFAPTLLYSRNGKYMVIGESDVLDYPGMIIEKSSNNGIKSNFSPYPLEEKIPSDTINYYKLKSVTKFADYIALTNGKRNFPWRVIHITENPATIPASDLILKLASPSAIKGDLSWIKPGQITDEWLSNMNLFHVSFKAGKNTASYKYYVDFVKKFGLEYIMIDEGWYQHGNLSKLNKELNLDSVINYASKKNIGIGLWFNASVLDENLEETLKTYAAKGVKIILVDFINRNDQMAMNFYSKLAEACARHKLMLNIHSAPAPSGFEITYPNAITREGVMGSEWNGWSYFVTPNHDLTIPFTRMFSGSLDYEPGLLENSTENGFKNIEGRPMSQGTRAHQIAMYIIYDNPLQYFVGNPSQGYLEPKLMKFIGDLPTTWDETIVLKGKPAEYIVTARLKNGTWYIGAMNNWSARELRIDLSKLGIKRYKLTGISDGLNSNQYASDYQFIDRQGDEKDKFVLKLSKGGGGVWRFDPIKN